MKIHVVMRAVDESDLDECWPASPVCWFKTRRSANVFLKRLAAAAGQEAKMRKLDPEWTPPRTTMGQRPTQYSVEVVKEGRLPRLPRGRR